MNQDLFGKKYKKSIHIFKKSIVFSFTFFSILSVVALNSFPLVAYGQVTQASSFKNGVQNPGAANSTSAQGATASVATCISSKYVSGLVSSTIGSLINPDKYTKVGTTGTTDDSTSGSSYGAVPSYNSIGYCVINGIIEYIADSTIAWINSGFDGNPAFVTDPTQFFKDIADQEAAGFLREVAYNTTGLDICQPFRLQILTDTSNNGGFGGGQSQCTLGAIGSSLQNFQVYTSGGSTSRDLNNWWNMTQNPQNNPYGARLLAANELEKRIALQKNTATLDLTTGNGFLSYKKCSKDSVDQNGKTVKGACAITTPGTVIEQQLNSRLKAGTDRLVLADKFDQVVNALVAQLIKTALNKTLSTQK